MDFYNVESEFIDSLDYLSPPVKRNQNSGEIFSRYNNESHYIQLYRELRNQFTRTSNNHSPHKKPATDGVQSSTSLILKKTSQRKGSVPQKEKRNPYSITLLFVLPSLKALYLENASRDIKTMYILERYSVVSYTSLQKSNENIGPNKLVLESKGKPLIKVTVIPKSEQIQAKFLTKKRKYNIPKRVQSTLSNQENSVQTANLYLVVAGRRKDKIYEIRTTGSATFSSDDTDSHHFRNEDFASVKHLIESMEMGHNNREDKTETKINESKEIGTNPCESDEYSNPSAVIFKKPPNMSRVKIYGQLGLTDNDRYVLRYGATVNDKPVSDFAQLTSTYSAVQIPLQEFAPSNDDIAEAKKDAGVQASKKQELKLQQPIATSFLITKQNGPLNNNRSSELPTKESQGTQVNLNVNVCSKDYDTLVTTDKNVQCSCSSTERNRLPNVKRTEVASKDCQSPLVIISVYPKPVPEEIYNTEKGSSNQNRILCPTRPYVAHAQCTPRFKIEKNTDFKISDIRAESSSKEKKILEIKKDNGGKKHATRTSPVQKNSKSHIQEKGTETKVLRAHVEKKSPDRYKAIRVIKNRILEKDKHIPSTSKPTVPNSKVAAKNRVFSKRSSPHRLQEKGTNTEHAKAKKVLVESYTKQLTEQWNQRDVIPAKLDNSKVTVNIDGEREYYNLLFDQGNLTTDLRIRKTTKDMSSQKDCGVMSGSLENLLVLHEKEPDTRPTSMTFYKQYDKNPANERVSGVTIRDSLEISHRREDKNYGNIKNMQTSNTAYCSDDFTNETEFLAPIKHFTGDDCSISDPVERDKQIRELLGVDRSKLFIPRTLKEQPFEKDDFPYHCFYRSECMKSQVAGFNLVELCKGLNANRKKSMPYKPNKTFDSDDSSQCGEEPSNISYLKDVKPSEDKYPACNEVDQSHPVGTEQNNTQQASPEQTSTYPARTEQKFSHPEHTFVQPACIEQQFPHSTCTKYKYPHSAWTDQKFTLPVCSQQKYVQPACIEQKFVHPLSTDEAYAHLERTEENYNQPVCTEEKYTHTAFTDQMCTRTACTEQDYTHIACTEQMYPYLGNTEQNYTHPGCIEQKNTYSACTEQQFTHLACNEQHYFHPSRVEQKFTRIGKTAETYTHPISAEQRFARSSCAEQTYTLPAYTDRRYMHPPWAEQTYTPAHAKEKYSPARAEQKYTHMTCQEQGCSIPRCTIVKTLSENSFQCQSKARPAAKKTYCGTKPMSVLKSCDKKNYVEQECTCPSYDNICDCGYPKLCHKEVNTDRTMLFGVKDKDQCVKNKDQCVKDKDQNKRDDNKPCAAQLNSDKSNIYQQLILNRNIQIFLQVEQFSKQRPIVLSRKQYDKVKKTIQNTICNKASRERRGRRLAEKNPASEVSVGEIRKKTTIQICHSCDREIQTDFIPCNKDSCRRVNRRTKAISKGRCGQRPRHRHSNSDDQKCRRRRRRHYDDEECRAESIEERACTPRPHVKTCKEIDDRYPKSPCYPRKDRKRTDVKCDYYRKCKPRERSEENYYQESIDRHRQSSRPRPRESYNRSPSRSKSREKYSPLPSTHSEDYHRRPKQSDDTRNRGEYRRPSRERERDPPRRKEIDVKPDRVSEEIRRHEPERRPSAERKKVDPEPERETSKHHRSREPESRKPSQEHHRKEISVERVKEEPQKISPEREHSKKEIHRDSGVYQAGTDHHVANVEHKSASAERHSVSADRHTLFSEYHDTCEDYERKQRKRQCEPQRVSERRECKDQDSVMDSYDSCFEPPRRETCKERARLRAAKLLRVYGEHTTEALELQNVSDREYKENTAYMRVSPDMHRSSREHKRANKDVERMERRKASGERPTEILTIGKESEAASKEVIEYPKELQRKSREHHRVRGEHRKASKETQKVSGERRRESGERRRGSSERRRESGERRRISGERRRLIPEYNESDRAFHHNKSFEQPIAGEKHHRLFMCKPCEQDLIEPRRSRERERVPSEREGIYSERRRSSGERHHRSSGASKEVNDGYKKVRSERERTDGELIEIDVDPPLDLNDRVKELVNSIDKTARVVSEHSKRNVEHISHRHPRKDIERERMQPNLEVMLLETERPSPLPKAASSLEIHYTSVAYSKQLDLSSSEVAVLSDSSLGHVRSFQTIFRGHRKCPTPNLGTSVYSLYTDDEYNSDSSAKYIMPPRNGKVSKRPFLMRLMSCLVMRSTRASALKLPATPVKDFSSANTSVDSYHISTSLGAVEVCSSIYDTTASFYSNHTIHPINTKMKRGFFNSVRGFLTNRKS